MRRYCPDCEQPILTGEFVELTVIAPYNELPSQVAYSIGTPIDALPDTLRHHKCTDLNTYA